MRGSGLRLTVKRVFLVGLATNSYDIYVVAEDAGNLQSDQEN